MSGSNTSSPDDGSPAEPLGLTVHSMPQPGLVPEDRERLRRGRLKMMLVLLVCALPVVASYFTYYVVRPSGQGAAYSHIVQPTVPLPAIDVRTLDGRTLPLASLKGQWLLLVVADSRCGEACEKRLYLQRQLREMMGRERDRIDKVWLITDDGEPAPALRAALEATPAMHLLRMPRAAVAAWLRPDQGRALDEHLYVVDPVGEWMMRAPAEPDPSKLKRDIDRLLRAAAGWDKAGR
ncbi:MAG: hypothetical protein HY855_23885 [Burkholderiales bacterium]|nr:hypothetical protein [Burkholderiales bacterium]